MRICGTQSVRLGLAVLLGLLGSAPSARAAVSINVGSATGAPGSTVTFQVTLSTGGAQVGGTLNSVSFDLATPIVACTTNPGMTLSECLLEPQDCIPGADCQSVRCFIGQFSSPPPPIADGTMLYFCSVKIAANASGSYQLVCSDASASDTSAHPLDTQCTNGQVQVPGFLVCDVEPHTGDNIGQFGSGTISISDVEAIFKAAQFGGSFLPAAGSARLSAMDAAPVDIPPSCGGSQPASINIADVKQCFKRAQFSGQTNYTRTLSDSTCSSAVAP